jgi:hypothetical protein
MFTAIVPRYRANEGQLRFCIHDPTRVRLHVRYDALFIKGTVNHASVMARAFAHA